MAPCLYILKQGGMNIYHDKNVYVIFVTLVKLKMNVIFYLNVMPTQGEDNCYIMCSPKY